MVGMSGALSPEMVAGYYSKSAALATGERAYYSKGVRGGEAGEFYGRGAAEMGIIGLAVTEERLARLANGQDAESGLQLIKWRPAAKEYEAEWIKSDDAWEAELKERFVDAMDRGRDVFRPESTDSAKRIERTPVTPPLVIIPERTEREKVLLEMHVIARQVFSENLAALAGGGAREYLKGRSIKVDTWTEFGLGLADGSGTQLVDRLRHYGPEYMRASGLFNEQKTYVDGAPAFRDRFRDRIMFPIESAAGETIAFGGRLSPNDSGPKYINSRDTDIYKKGDELFNFQRAQPTINETGRAVVVEGYLDVLAAHQAGVHNVVALSGTALSATQVSRLAENAKTVILNLDADAAGDVARERNIPTLLQSGLAVRSVETPHDAAAWLQGHTRAEYREEIRGARPLVEVLMEQATKKFDTASPFGEKGAAMNWVVSALQNVQPDQRVVVMEEFEKYLGTPKQEAEKVIEAVQHRAAWDMVFTPAKSVSATALPGGDERIIKIHERAVKEGLRYAERSLQVKMGGLRVSETTEKMVSALFLHDTARPVDGYSAPNLHTHAVIFNMSPDEDGQFRALDPRELFHIQGTVEAVYQNRLAVDIRRLGYEIEQGPTGAVEIGGYSKEYLEAESPRRAAIEEERQRLGQYGPDADHNIARNTRAAKSTQTPEEVKAAHLEHAAMFGHEPAQVVAAARGRRHGIGSAKGRENWADYALEWARSRLSERTTVMEDYEIHRDALKYGRGMITLPDVEEAFGRAKQKNFIEAKHWREYAPQQRWTTPELAAKERYILEFMAAGRGQFRSMSRGITKDEFRERFKLREKDGKHIQGLNDDQKWKVWALIHTEDRMVGISGVAGAGKTTSLAAAREFMEAYGYEVLGLAATSSAVEELQKAGVPALTVTGFVFGKNEPSRARMYFLDESSLIDVHQTVEFLAKLKPADRVVVIGDDRQHSSLGAGRIFRELQDAGMATWSLKSIVRQKKDEYRDIVRQLSRGEIVQALTAMDSQGQIKVEPDLSKRYAAIAQEYVSSPLKTLVVSPDNRSRLEIGSDIRTALKAAGRLGQDVYLARTLQPRANFTKADTVLASSYRIGDVVNYSRASRRIGIRSGDYASVLDVSAKRNELTAMRESDGKIFTYNPSVTGTTASVYEASATQFAIGDRIQTTKSLPRFLANRSQGVIEKLDSQGNAVLRMDRGDRKITINLEKMPHIAHGYVMTSYSAQGTTAPKVIAHLDTDSPAQALLNRAFIYVAWSRGQYDAVMFTNNREDLNRVLLRPDEKAMALTPEQVKEYRPMRDKGASVSV